jgi:competence protein ComEC
MITEREHSSVPIWHAPLVPVALAATAGIVLDRCFAVELAKSLATTVALALGWFVLRSHPDRRVPLALLVLAFIPLGASWHHWRCRTVAPDDICFSISPEGTMARLHGRIDAEPIVVHASPDDSLRSFPARDATRFLVRASSLQHRGDWSVVSGLVQATVPELRRDLHVGDEIELVGMLALPDGPANPGGFDFAAYCRDQGISAVLSVPASPGAVELVREGWPRTVHGWLAMARAWGLQVLERHVAESQRGVAAALLLGDNAAMSVEEWDQYLRTGVVHVLAISGQHLAVLAWFGWLLARRLGIREPSAAVAIAAVLFAYALLTGGRPPVMRAAWMVTAYAGGTILQRPVLPANIFAFAWLGVACTNPADIFNTGCQVSFVAVAVLIWGASRWRKEKDDPLERVVDESRSWLEKVTRRTLRGVVFVYAVNAAMWLAVTPLIAARYHLISPIALLLGPPLVLVSSVALLIGFGTLLAAGIAAPLAALCGGLTSGLLWTANALTGWADGIPGAYAFVPDLPEWWLWGFYLALLAGLMVDMPRRPTAAILLAAAGWLCLGLVLAFWPPRVAAFRCTFLAVGHGGCMVFDTPGGKTIVYDAGAITGPDVTRRHIAPYLWSRGVRRIDELLVSHGDLDHFNGIPALLERFAVGRLTLTPSFADRTTPGVGHTLRVFERIGVSTRVVSAGDRWEVDGISFEVLHPPERGPQGNENARSLVLVVRYADLALLLTGDLEGPGLARLLAMPPLRVDVLQAPHHGSRASNTPELAEWARPTVVISSQGPPRSVPKGGNAYEAVAARYLTTWPHGAITIRRDGPEFVVETFRTKERWPVR